jgi:hypothetical protein
VPAGSRSYCIGCGRSDADGGGAALRESLKNLPCEVAEHVSSLRLTPRSFPQPEIED